MTNEEFQRTVLEEFRKLNEKVDSLEKGKGKLETDVDSLKEGQKKLESGQDDIKNLLIELDPKNADRHLEITRLINGLREDLSTIEIVTSKNWNDIAKIKSVK